MDYGQLEPARASFVRGDVERAKPLRPGSAGVAPVLAILLAIGIRTFVAQAFFIPSASMFPTLQPSDRVLVERIAYLFGEPDRGDVIVF